MGNKLKYWIEAARPKTLPASVSPAMLGCALAWREGMFHPVAALLCLLVALLAQVASNFANDYFDFKKGADTDERLGPERAVATGRISPRKMLAATFTALALACSCGLGLLFFAGWELIPVGVAIALCVLAYSAGPFPLAYHGAGDVCVLLFYGIVPVCFTYYVQTLHFGLLPFQLSIAVGLLSVNILVVNNYRDYEQDRKASKRTTIVLFGPTFGRYFYLFNGIAAMLVATPLILRSGWWTTALYAGYAVLYFFTWRELCRNEGRALNNTLAHTARNVLLFTILLVLCLINN